MAARKPGKARDQELFRGDHTRGVAIPEPAADVSIVRHILYLDGAGRPTPYTSTTHDRAIAKTADRIAHHDVPEICAVREATVELGRGLYHRYSRVA